MFAYLLRRRNRAALSYRISRFCLEDSTGSSWIVSIAAAIASGQTISSEPNIMRFSKPASIRRCRKSTVANAAA